MQEVRLGALALDVVVTDFIEFQCGNARADVFADFHEGSGRDPAGFLHDLQFPGRFQNDHPLSLQSGFDAVEDLFDGADAVHFGELAGRFIVTFQRLGLIVIDL